MHHFESQLTSTVKCIREDPFKIVFRGHNRWGDGQSFLALFSVFGFVLLLMADHRWGFSSTTQEIVVIAALGFFTAAAAILIYEKTTTFDLQRKDILVRTLSLFGKRTKTYRPSDARLKVENIHIRLAENCGAIDLYLPDQTIIRLSVDRVFSRSAEKAKRLSENTGILLDE